MSEKNFLRIFAEMPPTIEFATFSLLKVISGVGGDSSYTFRFVEHILTNTVRYLSKITTIHA